MNLTKAICMCDDMMWLSNKDKNVCIRTIVHGYTTLQILVGDYSLLRHYFVTKLSVLLYSNMDANIAILPLKQNIEIRYSELLLDRINPHNIRCPIMWLNLAGKLMAQAGIKEGQWN